MKTPGGWEEDRWRCTRPGNYQWHLAKHENGVMIWIVDPGGRGDNYKVKAGTGTRLGQCETVAGTHGDSFDSQDMAELKAQELMVEFSDDPDPRDMKYA